MALRENITKISSQNSDSDIVLQTEALTRLFSAVHEKHSNSSVLNACTGEAGVTSVFKCSASRSSV